MVKLVNQPTSTENGGWTSPEYANVKRQVTPCNQSNTHLLQYLGFPTKAAWKSNEGWYRLSQNWLSKPQGLAVKTSPSTKVHGQHSCLLVAVTSWGFQPVWKNHMLPSTLGGFQRFPPQQKPRNFQHDFKNNHLNWPIFPFAANLLANLPHRHKEHRVPKDLMPQAGRRSKIISCFHCTDCTEKNENWWKCKSSATIFQRQWGQEKCLIETRKFVAFFGSCRQLISAKKLSLVVWISSRNFLQCH